MNQIFPSTAMDIVIRIGNNFFEGISATKLQPPKIDFFSRRVTAIKVLFRFGDNQVDRIKIKSIQSIDCCEIAFLPLALFFVAFY